MKAFIVRFKNNFQKEGFKLYLKNTSWALSEKILKLFSSLTIGIMVARYLGPYNFGIYSYAISFVSIFWVISSLGIDEIIVNQFVLNKFKIEELFGTAIVIKILGAFLSLGLLMVALYLTSNPASTKILIQLIFLGIFFQAFNVIEKYFLSLVKIKKIAISNILVLIISIIAKLYLIKTNSSLIAFALVVLLENILTAIFYLIVLFSEQFKVQIKIFSWKRIKFNRKILSNLLNESWPLILSSLSVIIYMRIDQLMINEILNEREVGLYSVGIRISEAWFFVPTIITSSMFPIVLRAKKISDFLYNQRLIYLYSLLIYLSIGISLILTLFSRPLILLLFGYEFEESSKILMIHIWSSIFIVAAIIRGNWFVSEGLTKYSLYTVSIGMLLNIFFNYFLINSYGIIGASTATLVSRFLSFLLIFSFFKKIRPTFKHFYRGLILPFQLLKKRNYEL